MYANVHPCLCYKSLSLLRDQYYFLAFFTCVITNFH